MGKGKRIMVDDELIAILDSMKKKLAALTYESLGDESYRKITKILARKIKEAGMDY